jgi:hypothetical protein
VVVVVVVIRAVRTEPRKLRGADDGRIVVFAGVVPAQTFCPDLVDRAGVRHLLGDAEFVQLVDDLPRLDFQPSRQLIDSDLAHVQEVVYLPTPRCRAAEPGQ